MTNDTALEILKGSLSFLPEDELTSIITAVKNEQNARKNKKRQELINKVIADLHDLQDECFGGGITVYCEDCGNEIYVPLGEIAEKIKHVE